MACFATPYGLRYAAHCFNRADAQNNRPALISAGGKLGVTSYTIIGEVKAKVRKATIFSKEASQKKIYRELWERGEKLGADAVINARYGDSHVTAFSWGSTTATGTAIKFNK